MRLVVVSDAHVLGPKDPVQIGLCAWLSAVEADHLVLLGDLLHAGWTWRGRPHSDHAGLFTAIEGLLGRGIQVSWVPGNHDFGVELDPRVHRADTLQLDCDGLRVLLAHGDEGDRSLRYWAIRHLLRGAPFGALVRGLGPEQGMRLLRRIAGGRHGPEVAAPAALVAAQRAWAAERLAGGEVDLVALGHSHVLGMVALPGGQLAHIGAWLGHRSWLEIEGGRPRLKTQGSST